MTRLSVDEIRTTADVHLVDVRTPAEFTAARIPGSVNIPLDQLDVVTDRIQDFAEPIVLVCRSGNRSGVAMERLHAEGVSHVRVLDGGLVAWQEADAPVAQDRQGWDLERQVRLTAGSLVLAGVLGSRVHDRAVWLAGGIGAGLVTAAVTNTCAMGSLLGKLPFNRRATGDVVAEAERLRKREWTRQGWTEGS